MINNTAEISTERNTAETWDMSDVPAFSENQEEMVKTEIKFWSNEYNTTEQQFAKYAKSEYSGDYRESLRKYENDVRFNWERLQDATTKAQNCQLIHSDYELADTQRLGVVEPGETIEAATGIFYDERAESLNKEILAHKQSEDGQADHAILRQTWHKVLDYIEAASDYETLHRDYDSYQSIRRDCHNRMIRQLNDINHLAEKYGTERFTARDFMTNDFYYDSKRDRGSSLNHRAEYDRESVLAYFKTAFSKDFDNSEKKAQGKERGMITGVFYRD